MPYLTQVGLLAEAAGQVDVGHALARLRREAEAHARRDGASAGVLGVIGEAFGRKQTLIGRPLRTLLDSAHIHSGWLATFRDRFQVTDGRFAWLANPLRLLHDTYHYLNMEPWPGRAPCLQDLGARSRAARGGPRLLRCARAAPRRPDWATLNRQLGAVDPPEGFDAATWEQVRAAHGGHQLGMDALSVAAMAGCDTKFFELRVEEDLSCTIPERLHDAELQARMLKVLAPPPVASANEIVAATGGMFYAQEAPGKPPFTDVGSTSRRASRCTSSR